MVVSSDSLWEWHIGLLYFHWIKLHEQRHKTTAICTLTLFLFAQQVCPCISNITNITLTQKVISCLTKDVVTLYGVFHTWGSVPYKDNNTSLIVICSHSYLIGISSHVSNNSRTFVLFSSYYKISCGWINNMLHEKCLSKLYTKIQYCLLNV